MLSSMPPSPARGASRQRRSSRSSIRRSGGAQRVAADSGKGGRGAPGDGGRG